MKVWGYGLCSIKWKDLVMSTYGKGESDAEWKARQAKNEADRKAELERSREIQRRSNDKKEKEH